MWNRYAFASLGLRRVRENSAGSMPHEEQRRQAPPLVEQRDELAEARALLQDPEQVAPVNNQEFGKRFWDILMQALKRPRRIEAHASSEDRRNLLHLLTSGPGTPRRIAAVRRFGRDRSEADIPRAFGSGSI
jgi:hypothetical protein